MRGASAEKEPAPASCAGAPVEIVGRLSARWHDAVAKACASVAALNDRDPSARVSISASGDELVVTARLRDGRSASRRVRAPAEVTPTLEALLAVPPAPAAPVAVDPDEPPDLLPRRPEAPPPSPSPVELGLGVGVRVAWPGRYDAASLEGSLQVRAGRWLFGAGVRWDTLQTLRGAAPPGLEFEALAVSLTAARRLETSRARFDVGASPRFVDQTQSAQLAAGEQSGSDLDVRVGGFTRASVGGAAVRFVVEADAEVSPTRLRRGFQIMPGFPDLPVWTAGLTAGVVWCGP